MPSTTHSLAQIDDVLAAAAHRGDVPGVVVAAADQDGPIHSGSFGTRTSEPLAALTATSVCWLGSMTKLIAAVAALQLVEAGQLSLDAPLGALLPQLARPAVLTGFDDDGQPLVRKATTPVTLRNLLAHTAGNGYHFWDADVLRYQEVMGLPGIIECRESTLTTPLMFDPGTRWEYGMNLDWVGKAVEAASGQRLEDYLRRHVLDPLGMADTTFVLTDQHRTRLAGMNFRTPDGLAAIDFEMTQEPEFQMAGGAMYGSAQDYLVLLQMILGRGEINGVRILQEETVAEAMRNQIGDLEVGPIASVDPASSYDVDFLPGIVKKWGLFGLLNESPTPQGRTAGGLFWAGLGNTYFWVDHGNNDCGVMFTQILPFGDPVVLDLFDQFETAVHGR
jgi:methyl acetate hydrolase